MQTVVIIHYASIASQDLRVAFDFSIRQGLFCIRYETKRATQAQRARRGLVAWLTPLPEDCSGFARRLQRACIHLAPMDRLEIWKPASFQLYSMDTNFPPN
jgi:hypothetical protein